MSETKEDRFIRVAEKRVNNILKDVRSLSNCSNRRMYSWSDKHLKKIWSTIDKEIRLCKDSFANKKTSTFKLD